MVKGVVTSRRMRRTRRRTSRRKPRRGKSSPKRAPVSRLPPALSMQANVANFWLRSVYPVAVKETAFHLDLRVSDLLTSLHSYLKQAFAEYRPHRVNVWFMSKLAITETGVHAMSVVDDKENYLSVVDYNNVASSPGSSTNRVYQTLCGTWFPTEPDDRNWKNLNDADVYVFQLFLATTRTAQSTNTTLLGELVFDFHLSTRGYKSPAPGRLSDILSSRHKTSLSLGDMSIE